MLKQPTPRELLASSRRLFPDWSTAQRHRWVRVKLELGRRPSHPIGVNAVENAMPDFLRALPRHAHLTVVRKPSDYVADYVGAVIRELKALR